MDKKELAGICGLFCGTCPAYPLHCHGCLSDYVAKECQNCRHGFRECSAEHQVTRCYECAAFPCERLEKFLDVHIVNGISHHQNVITDLRRMQTIGVGQWVDEQSKAHICPKCKQMIIWYEGENHKCEI